MKSPKNIGSLWVVVHVWRGILSDVRAYLTGIGTPTASNVAPVNERR